MAEKCGANKTDGSGDTCRHRAGWGTSHVGIGQCRKHGGNTPNANRHAETARAEQAVVTYGLPRDIDPHDALLEEVHRTAGAVEWLGRIVAQLDQGDLVWGLTKSGVERGDDVHLREAAPNVWLDLYQQERKHLVQVCKTAIAAGIDERRVQIAEQQATVLVDVIRATLDDLDVPMTEDVGRVVAGHLRVVDGGQAA